MANIRSEFLCINVNQPTGLLHDDVQTVIGDLLSAIEKFACLPFVLRLHLSDVTNQHDIVVQMLNESIDLSRVQLSIIEQAPANGAKIAAEVWFVLNSDKRVVDENSGIKSLSIDFDELKMSFIQTQYKTFDSDSYLQMQEEWMSLDEYIKKKGGNISDHVQRTWIYCRDIDNNYDGLVGARNDFFKTQGLNTDTHFIASTGIQARFFDPKQLVKMDSLCFFGLKDNQIEYLEALEWMSPTHIYGVSFERGTKILLDDESYFFISGTASIDRDGLIMHLNNIEMQTRRTLENIQALLLPHNAHLKDIKQAIVYLRDRSDYSKVNDLLKRSGFADDRYVIVEAPVCRPGWLIEIEAIAVK